MEQAGYSRALAIQGPDSWKQKNASGKSKKKNDQDENMALSVEAGFKKLHMKGKLLLYSF